MDSEEKTVILIQVLMILLMIGMMVFDFYKCDVTVYDERLNRTKIYHADNMIETHIWVSGLEDHSKKLNNFYDNGSWQSMENGMNLSVSCSYNWMEGRGGILTGKRPWW